MSDLTSEEFYEKEDCPNNDNYNVSDLDHWIFGRAEMILFAEEYHKAKLQANESSTSHNKALDIDLVIEIDNRLVELINDSEKLGKEFAESQMFTSECSSKAMAQAYRIVRDMINNSSR